MKKWFVFLIPCFLLIPLVFIAFFGVTKTHEETLNTSDYNKTELLNEVRMDSPAGEEEIYCIEVSVDNQTYELLLPSIEWVQKNGYPKNDLGETYGPNIKDSENEPDLIFAKSKDGCIGYLKQEDMDDHTVTRESVLEQTREEVHEINLYLHDGKTYVGRFELNG